jgi:chromosome segregation ATPase
VQSHQNTELDANTTQRLSYLESQNDHLYLELEAARSKPTELKVQIHLLETNLAKKNTTIKEKNSRVLHIEQANRRLEAELKEERRKIRDAEMAAAAATAKVRAEATIKMEVNGGWPERERKPAQKKRKRVNFVREGEAVNSWAID